MDKRQSFITENYFNSMLPALSGSKEFWLDQSLDEDHPGQADTLKWQNITMDLLAAVLLRYTAGQSIDSLGKSVDELVDAYKEYQYCLGVSEGNSSVSPFNVKSMAAHCHDFLQVVSLCILLDRMESLEVIAGMFDRANYFGRDALCEALLAPVLDGRPRAEECFHRGYQQLAELALNNGDPAEKSAALERYCEGWYAAMGAAKVYWHDSHLNVTDDDGSYFGYWALEAGAIAYLYDIDDSAIDDIVYPRDLVKYARASHQDDSRGPDSQRFRFAAPSSSRR